MRAGRFKEVGEMKKVLAMVLAIAFTGIVGVYAADEVHYYAGEMMAIGVGARPLGMGGTFAAIADDASTSYWNPAGLVNVQGVEVSSVKLTKVNDLETKYSYVNLVYNVSNDVGAFGAAWLRQAIGGITTTGLDGLGDPVIIENAAENSDNTFYIAYARNIVKGFALGLSVKILMGSYPAVNPVGNTAVTVGYTGFGADIGMYFHAGDFVKELKGLAIGCNFQDVYTTVTWDAVAGVSEGATETVDVNIKPGIAYKLPISQFEIVVASDVDTKYQLIAHAGLELWWNKMVALRGGIKYWGELDSGVLDSATNATIAISQEGDWSIGASLRWYFIGVDYAYVYNELTPTQYLSIIGKF